MRPILAVALIALAACSPDPVAPTAAHAPIAASFARKPRPAAADAPLSIAPEAITIAVGQTETLTSSYTIERAANFSTFYWGCAPAPDCWDVVAIVPRADLENTAASVTGLAPGTVQVYVADGLGLWAVATLTVTP